MIFGDINIYVFGNWKMSYDRVESVNLAQDIECFLSVIHPSVEVGVCPTFTSLYPVFKALGGGGRLKLCAQNCHFEHSGSYTGEVSASMLLETCRYVLLGHSERRAIDNTEEANLNKKIAMVISNGMVPVVCVGETSRTSDSAGSVEVVTSQILGVLRSIEQGHRVIIAYEPSWAIGSGPGVPPSVVKGRVDAIRKCITEERGAAFALNTPVLYGGSVSEVNAVQYIEVSGANGLLVGRASLDYKSFSGILREVSKVIESGGTVP